MKDLFYSNGMDIFGPVSVEEFSKNRYYKSTLIWYEGLAGWINIGDSQELKHLIGTMSTPALDTGLPQSLPNSTPPLTEVVAKHTNNLNKYSILVVLLLVLFLIAYFYNKNSKPDTGNMMVPVISNNDAGSDTLAANEAEIIKNASTDAEMKTYRLNWEKFIIAIPNDFKQKNLGGIEDLKIIVKNNSPYLIDSLMVKVIYLKANDEVYQTEMIRFDNIALNSSKELFAPSSDRGVKVHCTIISIHSGSMNLCCNKINIAKKGEDFCRCQ